MILRCSVHVRCWSIWTPKSIVDYTSFNSLLSIIFVMVFLILCLLEKIYSVFFQHSVTIFFYSHRLTWISSEFRIFAIWWMFLLIIYFTDKPNCHKSQIINVLSKQEWSEDWPLWNTTCYCPFFRCSTIEWNNLLLVTCLNSFQSISVQNLSYYKV